jgi:hypothetical protein
MLFGVILSVTVSSGCYDSLCLLPLLLLTMPIFGVPVLTAAFAINRRLQRPVPDGWLPTIILSGCLGQIAVSVFAFSTASPNFREIFFYDLLFVPQGFVAGLVTGAVFWLSLYVFGQKTTHS